MTNDQYRKPAAPSDLYVVEADNSGRPINPGPDNTWPNGAAEFAARWNAMTPEEREYRAEQITRRQQAEVDRISTGVTQGRGIL